MKVKVEENLNDEQGFEEIPQSQQNVQKQVQNQSPPGSNRPDLRVVQTEVDRNGKTIYKNVGGMWKNISKNGKEFYTLLIGNMRLLVFPNDNKYDNNNKEK